MAEVHFNEGPWRDTQVFTPKTVARVSSELRLWGLALGFGFLTLSLI